MFPLYAIVDTASARARGRAPVEVAREMLDGGARLLQLRGSGEPSGQLLEWADALVAAARPYAAQVIVNDRADMALMAGADGVHVGQDDVATDDIRKFAPAPFMIGLSTHTIDQLDAAAAQPIDYVAIGPVFGTSTKNTGYDPVGLAMVSEAARRAAGRPVVAIGGITLENAASVIAAGASSVAVISELLAGDDAGVRTAAFLRALR